MKVILKATDFFIYFLDRIAHDIYNSAVNKPFAHNSREERFGFFCLFVCLFVLFI